jgi:hypothetical protein
MFSICQILEKNNGTVLQLLFIDFKKAYDSVRREVLYNILEQRDALLSLLFIFALNYTVGKVQANQEGWE